MNRIPETIIKFKRRYIQLISAVLYNSYFAGFINGHIYKGELKRICAPGLNCYSCPGAVLSCPLGSFQSSLSESAYRFPLYILGSLLLFGILFGRMICGFLCPFGLFQELIYKIPTPKIKKNNVTRILSYMKYVILLLLVIAVPLVLHFPGFCKYICPAGTIEAGIPLFIMDEALKDRVGLLFFRKVAVLVFILILCVFCYRAFCRFLCPLGAVYSLFNPVSFFGIKTDHDKCINCGGCARRCKMDIKCAGDRECISCGDCREGCPGKAIEYSSFLKKSRHQ